MTPQSDAEKAVRLKGDTPEKAPRDLLASLMDVGQVVLDALPIGVYACDASGRILRVNSKAIELWGQAPRLLDSSQRFCGSFHLESLDRKTILPDETPMARAVLYGESFTGAEAVVENPDGKRWIARVDIAPLRDPSGVLVGAINCFQDVTHEHDMREALERQQHTFDLAMTASSMGTWRYTFDDNICVYDDNAQSLYGLTESRFLHDQEGVKAKFHPDDLDLMWSRVAAALDPLGDGHYDVEYRVKQLDGSWRWLSAWGQVEFDGDGIVKKPVAIAGASRDLTERKNAEQRQRLLLGELNHRVKNTLANIQAIAQHTHRHTKTPAEFTRVFGGRVQALARVHTQLTDATWHGADLRELIRDQLVSAGSDQLTFHGPSLLLAPQAALHLALVLHELGTNARKYGSLSKPTGTVSVNWAVKNDRLQLNWSERGGPSVEVSNKQGFGTVLIRTSAQSLGGDALMVSAAEGIGWEIDLPLSPLLADDLPGATEKTIEIEQTGMDETDQRSFDGKRILVVEDEVMLALYLVDTLEQLRITPVGPAHTIEQALRSIAAESFDAVLLDANLTGLQVDAVAAALTRKNVPFAFVTGYPRESLPAAFRHAPMLSKPFTEAELIAAVSGLLEPAPSGAVALRAHQGAAE